MFGSFCNMVNGAVVCSSLQFNAPPPPRYVRQPDGQVYQVEQLYKPFEGCLSSNSINSVGNFSVCF